MAFVDYRKAFDNILRIGLWRKLLHHNINAIFNLYSQVKSCVKIGIGSKISFFMQCWCLTRWEFVSIIVFHFLIVYMSELISQAYQGLDLLKDCTTQMLIDDDIEVYLKLYLLLYADDNMIIAPECELQAALNAAHHYCTLLKLVKKNKSYVFF